MRDELRSAFDNSSSDDCNTRTSSIETEEALHECKKGKAFGENSIFMSKLYMVGIV